MMIDAHIASFLTGFFLEPDVVSERRQLVKLIVLFLIHDILNSDNPSFSMKNYVAVLICRVRYIKNLNNLLSEYEWFVLVSDTFEVHSSDAVLIDLHTLRKFNPMASKQGDLEKYVVELPNLLYEPIVGVQPTWPDGIELLVKRIYADTAVLDCALPILSCRIKCVPIYVVSLPCHNCKLWPFCQP